MKLTGCYNEETKKVQFDTDVCFQEACLVESGPHAGMVKVTIRCMDSYYGCLDMYKSTDSFTDESGKWVNESRTAAQVLELAPGEETGGIEFNLNQPENCDTIELAIVKEALVNPFSQTVGPVIIEISGFWNGSYHPIEGAVWGQRPGSVSKLILSLGGMVPLGGIRLNFINQDTEKSCRIGIGGVIFIKEPKRFKITIPDNVYQRCCPELPDVINVSLSSAELVDLGCCSYWEMDEYDFKYIGFDGLAGNYQLQATQGGYIVPLMISAKKSYQYGWEGCFCGPGEESGWVVFLRDTPFACFGFREKTFLPVSPGGANKFYGDIQYKDSEGNWQDFRGLVNGNPDNGLLALSDQIVTHYFADGRAHHIYGLRFRGRSDPGNLNRVGIIFYPFDTAYYYHAVDFIDNQSCKWQYEKSGNFGRLFYREQYIGGMQGCRKVDEQICEDLTHYINYTLFRITIEKFYGYGGSDPPIWDGYMSVSIWVGHYVNGQKVYDIRMAESNRSIYNMQNCITLNTVLFHPYNDGCGWSLWKSVTVDISE